MTTLRVYLKTMYIHVYVVIRKRFVVLPTLYNLHVCFNNYAIYIFYSNKITIIGLSFSLTIARHRKNRANFKAMAGPTSKFVQPRDHWIAFHHLYNWVLLSLELSCAYLNFDNVFLSCHSISNKIKLGILTLKCQLYYEVMYYFNLDGVL